MRTQHLTALCLIICVLLFQTATAYKCYVCAACNDPFKKDGVKTIECSGICMKVKVKDVVARSCSPTKEKAECKTAEAGGIKSTTCYCDKDLCNGSYGIRASIATGIVTIITIFKRVL